LPASLYDGGRTGHWQRPCEVNRHYFKGQNDLELVELLCGKPGLFIFALFADLARHPELSNLMEEPFNIFQSIAGLIARYQSEGVLKSEHPFHSVTKLLALLIYISTMRNTRLDDTLPDLDLLRHVTSYLEGHCIDRKILEC